MAAEPQLTGMAKHFNAVTFTGRANVAKVSQIYDFHCLSCVEKKGATINFYENCSRPPCTNLVKCTY